MDKRKVIYNAVAGSGKTSFIIEQLDENKRTLILTYTVVNEQQIISRIIQKFGYIPDNIVVKGIFPFLYSFCLRPSLSLDTRIKGLTFKYPSFTKVSEDKWEFFMSPKGYIYSNKLSKLILKSNINYIERLNKFFDSIFIDEFQDLSSDELHIAFSLTQFNGEVKLLGDFFQCTYSTSNRGNNMTAIKKSLDRFLRSYEQAGYEVNKDLFVSSKRCSPTITKFISENLDILMTSTKEYEGDIHFIESKENIDKMILNDDIPKLFYQNSKLYSCNSMNWGESKGLTFDNVCVVLNPTTLKHYQNGTLNQLESKTKNKFYVACTRTKKNLYFIDEKQIKQYRIKV